MRSPVASHPSIAPTKAIAVVALAIAALAGAALFAASPAAADEITWLTMEFPPFYIHAGKDRGQGIADAVSHLLQRHLGNHTHREELAEPATIMTRLKAGDHVCSAAYIKTPERERVLEFSLPDLILPPHGITARRATVPRLTGGAARPVSLAKLLANRKLRLAVAVGRSYGPTLDTLLERTKGSNHVYWRHGEDIYRSLFDMLLKGSVDYLVGYPYEALYMSRERGVEGQVVTLPLVELPEYTLAHVVCPKTPWGRAVVSEVNRALEIERPRPEYRQAIERWLDPGLLPEFRGQYEAKFLGGAAPAQ
ncbi:MAG TPA: TIGR02285 family protein [Thermoanaerobaculia bacterium]|nr:TIGR02285 family protein [Thermoanaerobaculia bacterium]